LIESWRELSWSEKLYWVAASVVVGGVAILLAGQLAERPSWKGLGVAALYVMFLVLFFVSVHLHTRMVEKARDRSGRSIFSPLLMLDMVRTSEFYWFMLCMAVGCLPILAIFWIEGVDLSP